MPPPGAGGVFRMISARMSRGPKLLILSACALAVAAATAACGSEQIAVSRSNPLYQGAVLFNQRCAGCHTLSYAATHAGHNAPKVPGVPSCQQKPIGSIPPPGTGATAAATTTANQASAQTKAAAPKPGGGKKGRVGKSTKKP